MNEMTYRQAGDYQIPNLQLENEGEKPLGKYGRMRKDYLKEHRPVLWNSLLLSEKLYPHLREIDEAANNREMPRDPLKVFAWRIPQQFSSALHPHYRPRAGCGQYHPEK